MKSGGTVYTVAQVNTYIRDLLRRDVIMRALKVKGEISNLTLHGSGHIYFTLKDKTATISCVMFASDRGGLSFEPEEGIEVEVTGRIDVYPASGRYQLYATQIKRSGAGEWYERFVRIRDMLEEEGLFAAEYKREIPAYVRRLGVITAPTGAAVRDIIRNAKRRNPYVEIVLFPAIVQGASAADSIVRGLQVLARAGVDVIICGRGGGSIEDLWAFNEEKVARAIFDTPVPVISAVGHETDVTIADYVADLRAPTPSTAAELAVFEYGVFEQQVLALKETLTDAILSRIGDARTRLDAIKKDLKYLSPDARVRDLRLRADAAADRLLSAMKGRILAARTRNELYRERLKGLSFADRIAQGFAFVTDEKGKRIRSGMQVAPGDVMQVYFRDARISARAEKTNRLKGE
ncbi:MAG: exodeoxyribonuclease VII large subunit [Lachnospiraceae bacterium]|nr:exodeoxyribonuclease VII large subunit [Lachnospiraceae bacterium]